MGRRWQLKLLSLLLVLGAVEISLQAFYYLNAGDFLFRRVARPIYVPEPHAGFGVKPNLSLEDRTNEFNVALYTNSRGFRVSSRHEEYDLRKDPAKFRILLLGPSFPFGWGVNYEDTFGVALQRLLDEKGFFPGKSTEVINAGVPALLPGPQLNWYEHAGKDYHPDLVVQFIYGSMVVSNIRGAGVHVDAEGYLVRDSPALSRRLAGWAKQSALIFYGWTLSERLLAAWRREPAPREIAGAGRDLIVATRFDTGHPMIAESLRFYHDLRQAANAGGARLLIVFLPLSYAVHEEDIGRWRHLGVGDIPAQIEFNRTFCDHLNRTGFYCVNTTPALIADARQSQQRLYYWLDIHWTPRGHQVAARTVASYLLASPQRDWFAGESRPGAGGAEVLRLPPHR